ncbi:MAG: nucleoside monophosphate kinase [Bdellovibrionota bacterium]
MQIGRDINDFESKIKVEKVSLKGPGVLILTGPSSCGKGEVAQALSKVISIPPQNHLSMGEILRNTFQRAKNEKSYAKLLESSYQISANSNIFNCVDTKEELTKKVLNHLPEMEKYFGRNDLEKFTSQLDWLEFCTMNGLLVPNRWTQDFISAHIEHSNEFQTEPFILDGYPRTVKAAEHLLSFLRRMNIPVIKVLHLSISKQEMLSRATKRGRADDDEQSLLSRYQFYVENVHPSVDYLKSELGHDAIALVDAHQPSYKIVDNEKVFDLSKSILNVVASSLRCLGVSRLTVKDLLSQLESF